MENKSGPHFVNDKFNPLSMCMLIMHVCFKHCQNTSFEGFINMSLWKKEQLQSHHHNLHSQQYTCVCEGGVPFFLKIHQAFSVGQNYFPRKCSQHRVGPQNSKPCRESYTHQKIIGRGFKFLIPASYWRVIQRLGKTDMFQPFLSTAEAPCHQWHGSNLWGATLLRQSWQASLHTCMGRVASI